jgi:acetylglutamate kinase
VKDADGQLLSSIEVSSIEQLIADGVIKGGMIPKLRCCASAISGGVNKAHIIDGRQEHAILLEIFTLKGIGTEITA